MQKLSIFIFNFLGFYDLTLIDFWAFLQKTLSVEVVTIGNFMVFAYSLFCEITDFASFT